MHPPREHRAKVVVRNGKDAFIRSPQAQTRKYPADRNAGGEISGLIGSWGGPTALRYLIKFDIRAAFLAAGVEINSFKVKRARLKLVIADDNIERSAPLPLVVYPLEREFAQGTGTKDHRPVKIDGCTWFHSAPHMVWHREGGDFTTRMPARGKLKPAGTSFIDVTDIIRQRIIAYQQDDKWHDPGMIIMGDPLAIKSDCVLSIYSFAARARNGSVLAPELLIE